MATSLYKLVSSCSEVVEGGYKVVAACTNMTLQLSIQFRFLGCDMVVNFM